MLVFALLLFFTFALTATVGLASYLYGENRILKTVAADGALRELTTQAEARDTLERLFEKAGVPAPNRPRADASISARNRRFVSPSQFKNELLQNNEGRTQPIDLNPQTAPLQSVPKAQIKKVPESVQADFLRETAPITV